jgi:hypothetical protein
VAKLWCNQKNRSYADGGDDPSHPMNGVDSVTYVFDDEMIWLMTDRKLRHY